MCGPAPKGASGAPNTFEVDILEDGSIRVTSSDFSGPAHMAAEKFLLWVAEQAGGPSTRQRIAHTHVHEHAHEHAGHKH